MGKVLITRSEPSRNVEVAGYNAYEAFRPREEISGER